MISLEGGGRDRGLAVKTGRHVSVAGGERGQKNTHTNTHEVIQADTHIHAHTQTTHCLGVGMRVDNTDIVT